MYITPTPFRKRANHPPFAVSHKTIILMFLSPLKRKFGEAYKDREELLLSDPNQPYVCTGHGSLGRRFGNH